MCGFSSSGRAPPCQGGGSEFEPRKPLHFFASVAQLVEQGTENPRVVGSIPTEGTKYAGLAHLVERHLAKVEVASSSLVTRSKSRPFLVGFFAYFPVMTV